MWAKSFILVTIVISNFALNSAIPTSYVSVYPVEFDEDDILDLPIEVVEDDHKNGHARFLGEGYAKRDVDFLGMRGKKSDGVDFFGMRGKKAAGPDFLGMRGKKDGPDFLGMRGKKDGPDFLGMRGKKATDFYGVRGKKGTDFYGVRGKKEVQFPDELLEMVKRIMNRRDAFTATRG